MFLPMNSYAAANTASSTSSRPTRRQPPQLRTPCQPPQPTAQRRPLQLRTRCQPPQPTAQRRPPCDADQDSPAQVAAPALAFPPARIASLALAVPPARVAPPA